MKILLAFFVNAVFNFIIGLAVAKFLGPDEYGRYSLAVGLGLALQMALLEWLRLAAIRFYSLRARQGEPEIRATLDYSFLVVSALIAAAAVFIAPWGAPDDRALLTLALATSIIIGMFDYCAALARAAFNDRSYVRLVIAKNILSLGLTYLAAAWTQSAIVTLVAADAAMIGSIALAYRALCDDAPRFLAKASRAKNYFAYAAPIIFANLLYLVIPLGARMATAKFYGFWETGQMSLAYDVGLRALQAVGSALDILLFQIAVAARENFGVAEGRAQIARNITVLLAIVAPAGLGLYYVTPSLEVLVVPEQFSQKFGYYLTLMTPGLMALMLIMFAINPIFQLEKYTFPTIVAALIGALSAPFILLLLPMTEDAGTIAIAQSLSYGLALAFLCFFARDHGPKWPSFTDLAAISAALIAMAAVLQLLTIRAPGAFTLLLQLILGALVYGGAALALNVADFRDPFLLKARELAAKIKKH